MKYILKNQENKTMLIKTNKEIGNIDDRKTIYKLLDTLHKNKLIDLDTVEDLEFGRLYIPREDEFNFLCKVGFKVYEIEI